MRLSSSAHTYPFLAAVPEAVGGPISITAVSVALCKDDSDNSDVNLAKKKKKKKKDQKKQKKPKREVDLRTVAVPVLEEAQRGLHAVKEEQIAP